MDQVCTHYSLLIVHNSFLNVVRSHPCHWFGLISTLSTVEWTSVSNPIHESAQLLDWSINNCLLKSLGVLSVECLVLNPRLDKGRRRRWYNRSDKSMYNTCACAFSCRGAATNSHVLYLEMKWPTVNMWSLSPSLSSALPVLSCTPLLVPTQSL